MGEVKQINIKNWTYYFYNDITDLKNLYARLLKVDKKHYKGINIYYIGYITIKQIDEYESIYSVNPLYLHINHASGSTEEQNGNKYLIFDSVEEKTEVLKNTQIFGMVVKKMIMKKTSWKLNLILTMTGH